MLPQTFFELQIDPIFIQRSNNLQSISPYGYAFKKLESEDLIKSIRYDNYIELKWVLNQKNRFLILELRTVIIGFDWINRLVIG